MKKEIHISSVGRSGQHAFCNWLCKNLNRPSVFFNVYKTLTGSMKTNTNSEIKYNEEKNNEQPVTNIYLHENHLSGDNDYVLLRDPFNWISSLLIAVKRTPEELKAFIGVYIQLYEEVIKFDKKNFISYNSWFSDAQYKRTLANQIGLDSIHKGVDDVMIFGNGSSFNQRTFDKRARQMNVLNRYKTVLNGEHANAQVSPEEFKMVFLQNPKLIEIASDLFGMDDIL